MGKKRLWGKKIHIRKQYCSKFLSDLGIGEDDYSIY